MALLLAIFTILFCMGWVSAGAPILPIEFYGPVTITGAEAPVGTIIIALSNGAERGRIVTTKAGYYGGSGTFDDRLKVIIEEGDEEISFTINGQEAFQTWPPDGGSLKPGVSSELTLSVGAPSPTPVPTTPVPTTVVPTTVPTTIPPTTVPTTVVPTTVPTTVPPTTVPTTVVPTTVPTTVPPTVIPTVTPDNGVPSLPETFYGTVHIYGLPASAGGHVELRVPSLNKVVSVPITEGGKFGGWSSFDEALSLQGIEDGTPVEFWVQDVLFQYPSLAYVMVWGTGIYERSVLFQSGTLLFIDLAVSDAPPPIPTLPPTPAPTPTPTPLPPPSNGVPSIPHTFYGTVSVYGDNIQVGGTIEAQVTGYDVTGPDNPYTITHVGTFGGNSTWEKKLTVQGNGVTDGSPVLFLVADKGYQRAIQAFVRDSTHDPNTWYSSLPYHAGAISVIDLYVGNSPPTPTPTPYPIPTSGRQQLPQWFYGSVSLDGLVIPAGSQVKATVNGELYYNEQDPVIVSKAGYYGDGSESKDNKLKIWDENINPGDSVEFYIKTDEYPWWIRALCKHPQAGTEWQEAWRYQPGSITNLDLQASSSTPFEEVASGIGPVVGILSP